MGYDWSTVSKEEFDAMPELLGIMREVAYMEERPEPGMHRTYYDFKKKNLEEFLKRWEKMEEAFMYKFKETVQETVVDEGEEAALEKIEMLLKEFKA